MATNPALPFDYMARLDRQNRRRQQASNDPVGDALRGIQTQEQVDTLRQAPAPDRVARTTRLAREAQDSPFNVEGREDEVQTSLDAQRFGALAERYPAIGRFAQANPRGAAMARDDHESLGLLGTAWDFLKNAPGRIVGGIVYGVPQGINSIYGAVEDLNQAVQSPIYAGLSALSQASGVRALDPTAMLEYDRQRRSQRDSYFSGLSESVKTEYRGANTISEGLLVGTDSVGLTLAAIATGNPSAAAGVLGGMVGAQAYGDARAKGWDAARALRYGVVQGSIEGVTEKIPASTLLDMITRKLPFGKAFVREFGQEMTGEQFATFFQDLSDYSQDPANRDKSIGDFWRERPQAALSTALAVAGGTSVTTGGIALTQRAADATVRFSKRRSEAEAARRDAEGLDKLDKALGASKLKGRDADALRQVLAEQAKDAGTQHVFIPADAVRAYQQSDGYDGSQDPWASLDWQDVELAGGDIVMPIEEALTKVVGTPAWDAVKADVRLTAGGMSLREADDFDAAFADIQDTLSEQAKAQDVADQAGKSVREKLVGELALKFGESYTADVARKYAELAVQRAATRAARQGSELTASEFANLDVKQVLPEGVAQAVQSDTLDLVVNAMRQGKPTEVGQGESLLAWIKARGGINDTGGDLASMGLPKRLIRTSQRDMLQVGSGDYGVDSTLRAAISDGFFPELAGVEGQAGPSQLDTQVLLDAIGRELAGEKVFRETRADPMRQAGEELRGILSDAGLDPATASDADIRAAVAAFEAGSAVGRGYEQVALPKKVDIDGTERWTVNSEGMPIGRDEAAVRAFWAWFGDSKVVDAEGRPLVVYHGTTASFDAFERSKSGSLTKSDSAKLGFWFTSDPRTAQSYADFASNNGRVQALMDEATAAERKGDWDLYDAKIAEAEALEARLSDPEQRKAGQQILPTYLRIERPSELDAGGEFYTTIEGGLTAQGVRAKVANQDGVIVRNLDDAAGLTEQIADHYLVFDSTQIKSINNRGTFDPSDPRILYQPAYHGSPHIFDKFSLDRIGSGEGAQAYGWGLYFAGRKEIAQFYRNALSRDGSYTITIDGVDKSFPALRPEEIAEAAGMEGPRSYVLQYALGEMQRGKTLEEAASAARGDYSHFEQAAVDEAIAALRSLNPRLQTSGRLYEVEIPEDNEYLLWDKPLSEQPEKVRAAIERVLETRRGLPRDWVDRANFSQIYGTLNGAYAKEGEKPFSNAKDVSLALHEAGIAGIKYLDANSRSKGDGSFNYVVFDDSRVSIRAYEQEARGRIIFEEAKRTIELFQSRNRSTPIHELGHMWLEELQADAAMPDAPEQVKEDWATVAKWFADNGHEVGDGQIPTEAHELWARGTERYIMEGKAPSPLLTRLFETMGAWLVNIYRTVQRLNTPITPEIREVFDRLLATDEEIAAAREEQALTALFKDMPEGMRPEEFTAYQAQVAEAKAAASSTLLDKTMRTIRRQTQERYRGYRKAIRAEETARIDGSPLFTALSAMKADRIDKTWLTDNFGADVTDLLPVRVPPLYREGGADPEAVAELAGYPSARDMIEALIGAEKAHRQDREGGDQRSMRERAIDTATDAEFNRRYGDPFNDGSIEREALAAIHNDRQGEVMASELRILSRSTGQRPTPYRAARTWARRRVREGVVAEQASLSAIAQHRRNSAKAGRAAEAAIMAGDAQEAFRQKQAQMLSSALLAEAKEAYDEVAAAERRLSKLAKVKTRKSVDQDYLEQAQALLENVELRKRSQLSIDRAGKWEAWAQAREAEGYDVLTPPSFEAMLGKTNYTRLPVQDFLMLDEQVKQILHLGRLKQTLLNNEDARQWDAIIRDAVDGAGNLRGKPPADMAEPGWWDALTSGALAADAALLKMETVFDWLDGGNSNGVFNRVAFRPIAEAQAREQDMLKEYYARIKGRFKAVPAEVTRRWNDRLTAPWMDVETDRPMVLNRKQAIAMALNIGNEGNLQRLADGYSVNPSAIESWLGETLTAEEWSFVQGVWDDIDTLWPEIASLERKVNGVAPDKVEPRSFDTPHGTMRGGYYPAVYDSTRDYRAEENRGRESDLLAGNFTKATTRSSSTKERAEKVNRPILLDLGVINRHLGEVIHDITHREAVINANRMLSNERVRRAIDAALGREIGKQLRPWVKHVANSWALERAGNEGIGKWLGKLRANVTAVGMGLRATTMVTQIAGYSNSFEVVGEQWVAPQIARFAASPIELTRFVMERSGELRHRMDTLDRDIASQLAITAATNPATKAWAVAQEAKAFMFHGIGYMDRLVSIPTWLGAYNKALAIGMSEQDAAYAGDKAVRISQGAGAAKDLAAIQRGTGKWGEALKLMTMFYSFFSAQYQRQRTLGRDAMAKDTRKTRSPRLVARAFWLLVVPPLLVEVLRAGVGADAGPDDDEWWAQWVMRKLLANSLGPIPVARDLFEPSWQAAIKGEAYNPSISPLQRVFDVTFKNAGNVGKIARGEETKRATKDALEFAGYTTGLVPGQVASAVQFAVDVGEGEADPEGLRDWTQGLLTGKLEE